MLRTTTRIVCALAAASPLLAQDLTERLLTGTGLYDSGSWKGSERPDLRPPPGVEYAELLTTGQFEFSWQWTGDLGDGVRSGASNATSAEVFAEGFSASPRNWRRNEHRFGFYYGASDDITLALLVPLVDTEIKFELPGGGTYRDRASGLGDVELGLLYALEATETESFSVGARITLPIGSTDEEDSNPFSGGLDQRQPYMLQPGGGTFGMEPAITWQRWTGYYSWGAQLSHDVHLGENGDDWAPGDRTELDAWFAKRLTRDHSISLRVRGSSWESIDGADPDIETSVSPLHVAANSGGTSVDLFAGLNMVGIEGHRFAVEIGGPVYQDLDGTQGERNISYQLGWRYSF